MEMHNSGLNEVRLAVYRAALKLHSLQKLCQMHLVTLQDLRPILNTLNRSGDPMIKLSQEDVEQSLEQLFQNISKELPGQAVPEATDQTTRLLFKLFDREQTGAILLRSVVAALIVLSGDTLSAKHRALFQLTESYIGNQDNDRGTISRSALGILLEDLSQVPAVVQENHIFGPVEMAVASCFNGVISANVTEEHFLRWLQSEPRLLLWLSTLYRLSVSESVQHRVRCHGCKVFPIAGLRYRCLKCLNTHLCQNCFLTERRSRKHKPSHPVLEYCTQPTWKESVASLASSARRAFLPRHHSSRDAERTQRALRSSSSTELRYIASSPVQMSAQAAQAPAQEVSGSHTGESADPAVVTVECKALQTEDTETAQTETSVLQKDLGITQKAMRDLQRDKWLLEKEFQVWRVTAQSEHDSLEDKCSELKTMMEALNQHNQHLEEELERVRHVISLRDRNEHLYVNLLPQNDDGISENDWTPPACLKPHDSFSEGEEAEEERTVLQEQTIELERTEMGQEAINGASEDTYTNLDDTDSVSIQELQTALEQQASGGAEGEGLKEEEEELQQDLSEHRSCFYDVEQEKHSGLDDSEMEEELCELVQRLRKELSLYTPTGSVCVERGMLITAAEGLRDSISHLVSSVSASLHDDNLSHNN